MAPIKSSLARSVGKLLGVSKDTDLSLRGDVQSLRVVAPIPATGGNIVESGGYTYHVFLEDDDLVIPAPVGPVSVEYLIIGGGGSGATGGSGGGGGGAGGFVTNVPGGYPVVQPSMSLPNATYPVVVGDGGASVPHPPGAPPTDTQGNYGSNSSFNSVIAYGGGGGGAQSPGQDGSPGASAGGGGNTGGVSISPPTANRQTNTNNPIPTGNQGNDGGSGHASHLNYASGGGGGAGGAGGSASSSDSANNAGGNGHPIPAFAYPTIQPAIPVPLQPTFGPAVGPTGLYGGGGGGGVSNYDNRTSPGHRYPTTGGQPGGPGGGGRGGASGGSPSPFPTVSPTAGVTNTGGGGGGSGGGGNTIGQAGGKGIVIIRYQPS